MARRGVFLPPSDDPKVESIRRANRKYREKNREKRREWNNKWVGTNAEWYTYLRVQSNARRRRFVLCMYSDPPKCSMCGFSEIDGLVLDHVNDNGNEHRKDLGISCRGNPGGKSLYELIRRGGKIEGLQVLCANCNTMKHVRRLRCETLKNDAEKIAVVEQILRG